MSTYDVKTDDDDDGLQESEQLLGSTNDDSPRGQRGVSYEDAISQTGYGWFQYRLLALCGWALSSDAIEILCISFVLPAATEDLHLTDSLKGWVNSSVFLGMMVGGYLWGTLADFRGRRGVLLWSLTLNALGGLASSFAPDHVLFIILRFISGIGVGGSMPIIFTYYCEFQPKDRRGSMISLLATFWMCGNIVAAGLAWLVIPRSISGQVGSITFTSWRLYLVLCILPSFTSALLFLLMPESPRFLMQQGKEDEALRVLRRVHRSNLSAKSGSSTYTVEKLDVRHLDTSSSYSQDSYTQRRWTKTLKLKLKNFFMKTADLFKPDMRRVTVLMMIIFFVLSFGYYGLFMWFPELFNRIEKYGGTACNPGTVLLNHTSPQDVTNTVYLEGFLTAVSNLPGNIFTLLVIDRVGRKPLLVCSMLLSGLSVFFIWFLKTKTDSIVMACVFGGVSVIGWNTLDVLQVELFPTKLRSTSAGVLTGLGRIAAILGNLTFGELVSVYCAVPMILVASLLGFGGLLAIKLPNSTGTDLH